MSRQRPAAEPQHRDVQQRRAPRGRTGARRSAARAVVERRSRSASRSRAVEVDHVERHRVDVDDRLHRLGQPVAHERRPQRRVAPQQRRPPAARSRSTSTSRAEVEVVGDRVDVEGVGVEGGVEVQALLQRRQRPDVARPGGRTRASTASTASWSRATRGLEVGRREPAAARRGAPASVAAAAPRSARASAQRRRSRPGRRRRGPSPRTGPHPVVVDDGGHPQPVPPRAGVARPAGRGSQGGRGVGRSER